MAQRNHNSEPKLIAPHGGHLVNRLAEGARAGELRQRASRLAQVSLTPRQLSDVEMIAVGAFSPLTGFMGTADYWNVLHHMRLANWVPWTLPVTLAVERDTANGLASGEEVALAAGDGRPLAVLELAQKYEYDKPQEAKLVYGTDDQRHPGVAALFAQGEILLSGAITAFDLPDGDDAAARALVLSPSETRDLFARRGWRRIVGFQTRNPIHRAHEYLQKCALEMADGLLVHPLVGETKQDDLSSEVRLRCYQALLERYFPPDRVLLAAWPAAMRYAGPREAIFHALARKNYGCTHFIVGRDHAGVGNYYGPYDAQYIFDEFEEDELGITPLFFDHAFFCRACGGMATLKTCAHDEGQRIALSGTRVREMLSGGQAPPPEFTRPEVAQVLLEAATRTTG